MPRPALDTGPTGDVPPLIGAVRSYWDRKCTNGRLPSRNAIRPAELKAWLPYILLADVIDGGADFRYRLVGTRIAQDFTAPPTGRMMSEAIGGFGERATRQTIETYAQVVKTAAPLQMRGDGEWYAQGAKTFDAVLLPLSDDGETVNMVLGAFVFVWDRNGALDVVEAPLALALKG